MLINLKLKILIVSATQFENRLANGLSIRIGEIVRVNEVSNHKVDLLVTGVGAVQSAFWLSRYAENYQLIINIGIAGSYISSIPIGSVVNIKEDVFGDYGVDDKGQFKSLSEINLLDANNIFVGDKLINPWLNTDFFKISLPKVKGVTLSTASGSKDAIDKIVTRWNPDIETMEGAAVFYACRMLNVKFICLRAISNMVEPRDRSNWRINEAIENLSKEVRYIIENI